MADRQQANGTPGPAVSRLRLRRALRQVRETANLSLAGVAKVLGVSLSKAVRMEAGTVGVSKSDLLALGRHYGILGSSAFEEMLRLADIAKRRTGALPWHPGVSPTYIGLLGLETEVHHAEVYDPVLIPALLRTPAYTRALPGPAAGDIEPLGTERLRRLTAPERTTRLHAVIDESALGRQVGGSAVMREQISVLLALAAHPAVQLRISPTDRPYPGLDHPVTLLHPSPDDAPLLYVDHGLTDAVLIDDPEETGLCRSRYAQLWAGCYDQQQTANHLTQRQAGP